MLHSIEQDSRQTAEHYFSRLLSMLADPGSEVKLSWEKIVDVLKEIDDGPLATQLTEKYGISYREREREREREEERVRRERERGERGEEGRERGRRKEASMYMSAYNHVYVHVHVGDTS